MKKQFILLGLSCLLSLALTAVAWAYNPGQRTYNLLGNQLNCSRQPVHVELEQQVDLAKIMKPEAYALLEANKKSLTNSTIYNEQSPELYGQRLLTRDGQGKLVKDINYVVREGQLYVIDNIKKSYDRLPNVPGLAQSFAQGLVPWFNEKPEAGVAEELGADYDLFTLGKRSLKVYFQAGTDTWLGYQLGNLAPQQVKAYDQQVEADALALPPADYQQVPNTYLREQAQKLVAK